MKLLSLVTDPYDGFGGIARYNRNLLDALGRGGAQIHSIARLPPRVPCAKLPDTLHEEIHSGPGALYALRSLSVARSLAPDVVLCGHVNLLPAAYLVKRYLGVPVVLIIHGFEAWQRLRWPRPQMISGIDRILAVSRFTRRRVLSWAAADPQRAKILSNTIHLDRYGVGKKPQHLLQRYDIGARKVILSVGRLDAREAYKGHDRIIRALGALGSTHPDPVFLVVGEGSDRARLEALAKAHGVGRRVLFAGAVFDSELIDYYQLADAFAMPSTGEGFGIVFLEALACGLPVLAGNVDGSSDAVADGEFGQLVDPHDDEAVKAGLVQVLSQPKHVPEGLARYGFDAFARAALEHFRAAAEQRTAVSRVEGGDASTHGG